MNSLVGGRRKWLARSQAPPRRSNTSRSTRMPAATLSTQTPVSFNNDTDRFLGGPQAVPCKAVERLLHWKHDDARLTLPYADDH